MNGNNLLLTFDVAGYIAWLFLGMFLVTRIGWTLDSLVIALLAMLGAVGFAAGMERQRMGRAAERGADMSTRKPLFKQEKEHE